jgi:hypothetical protein
MGPTIADGRGLRRVIRNAAPQGAGEGPVSFYLQFTEVTDHVSASLGAGLRVVYRSADAFDVTESDATSRCRRRVYDRALHYVRAQTADHQPVRGVLALARAIHVHHRAASAALVQLTGEGLIANEPEPARHGPPKPRYWACSGHAFTRPTGPAGTSAVPQTIGTHEQGPRAMEEK